MFPMLRFGKIEHLRRLVETRFPSVIVGEQEDSEGLDFSHVDVNRERAYYLAVQHLVQHGHRRVAFLFPENARGGRRRTGAQRALAEAGLSLEERWIGYVRSATFEETRQRIRPILENPSEARPTAVLGSGAIPCMAVLRTASDLGLIVPKDLAVVSFGDDDFSAHGSVAVTTVSHQEEEVGKKACEELLRLIENPNSERRHVSIEPQLILRSSCGCKNSTA
jgi:LacI family transcriptional regulator